MSRSASRLTSGFSSTPRTTLKMAALAPMPRERQDDGQRQPLGLDERTNGESKIGKKVHGYKSNERSGNRHSIRVIRACRSKCFLISLSRVLAIQSARS